MQARNVDVASDLLKERTLEAHNTFVRADRSVHGDLDAAAGAALTELTVGSRYEPQRLRTTGLAEMLCFAGVNPAAFTNVKPTVNPVSVVISTSSP